jgi:hypothetical protein
VPTFTVGVAASSEVREQQASPRTPVLQRPPARTKLGPHARGNYVSYGTPTTTTAPSYGMCAQNPLPEAAVTGLADMF